MFAEGTEVSAAKSKAEIEKTLKKYKATGFGYAEQNDRAAVTFVMKGRQIRFVFDLPVYGKYKKPYRGRSWLADASEKQVEAEVRRIWRCVAWSIKMKLDCVESGVSSFDNEFMAHIVLPDGKTVSDTITPAISEAYSTGRVPLRIGYTK